MSPMARMASISAFGGSPFPHPAVYVNYCTAFEYVLVDFHSLKQMEPVGREETSSQDGSKSYKG